MTDLQHPISKVSAFNLISSRYSSDVIVFRSSRLLRSTTWSSYWISTVPLAARMVSITRESVPVTRVPRGEMVANTHFRLPSLTRIFRWGNEWFYDREMQDATTTVLVQMARYIDWLSEQGLDNVVALGIASCAASLRPGVEFHFQSS